MTSEIDIITLFPEMFTPLENSIIKRAVVNEILKIRLTQLRDFAFYSPRENFRFSGRRAVQQSDIQPLENSIIKRAVVNEILKNPADATQRFRVRFTARKLF